jgi:hypothetical protein
VGSPYINRFLQPDTIIPDQTNPQSWNRYSYVANRPINTNDPSGHWPNCQPGLHCPPKGDKRDLTKWIVAAAVDIAESREIRAIAQLNSMVLTEPSAKSAAYASFYALVSDGAKYDVKDNILAELKDPIKIGDSWYEYSTPGNILFGFYGKAAGFDEEELRRGAGIAQQLDYMQDEERGIGPCGAPYYCDTEVDYYAVGFGMFLYDEYYKPNGKLTETDLLEAFDRYDDANKMDLKPSPRNFTPKYTEYSPSHFYNME